MPSDRSRFELVTRRAFLERAALVGAAAGFLAACGANDDAKVFAGATSTAAESAASTAAAATSAAAQPSTTAAARPAGSTAAAAETTVPIPAGDPLPAGAELQIAFTFAAASAGGRPARNPYIAVWIEDANGRMVQTVSLWLQSGKGEKWWRDLTRWYKLDTARAAGGGPSTAETVTGATRTAGDYTVAWDGNDYAGARVGQGTYYVCIEAAREHGPYQLIREKLALGTAPVQQALTAKGELTAATVSYLV